MTIPELLDTHFDEIIQIWFKQAELAASSQGLTRDEVIDSLRQYLQSLAQTLRESGAPAPGPREQRIIDVHLSTRLRQGFNLDEVVHEYTFLGESVARRWSQLDPAERPTPSEIGHFFMAMNRAITTAVATFTKHLGEDDQTQKRYLRLLDQIATEALADQQAPLHERLDDVVAVVLAGMKCDTAALLLRDPETNQLVMAASAGLAEERTGEYTALLGSSAFVAEIAAADEALVFVEEFTSNAEVSQALRRSGIESLLGHPLRARGQLVGVLYVGLRERRAFTSWERRRMSALAQRLALLLDNARLFQERQDSIERLEAERALREQFVSILAHDLRGPLSAAKMAAQLLLRHPERLDERRDLAIRIDSNIDRSNGMIRDLLDANRIRAGQRLPLRLDWCDLGAIASEVVSELETLHGERFVLKARAVRGVWSAEELRRALWNLTVNAVKYGSPDTPITLTVKRTGDEAVVLVHNRGTVLSPDEQAGLFDPFMRTRAAEASGRHGWGLGLTLVRGCAQAHGGSVRVESTAEEGTTFTLQLPLDARPYQPVVLEATASSPAGNP